MDLSDLIVPRNSCRCAVLIPTHKVEFLPIEKYCINKTIKTLCRWDVFFIIPESLSSNLSTFFPEVESIKFEDKNFQNIDQYNRFRLSAELHKKFILYDRMLICEPDAIVMNDHIDRWSALPIDYVGAPWFNLITMNPNFESRPDLNGVEYKLDVGNGGLCMVNPRSILHILDKHSDLVKEFMLRSGGQLNSDAFLAFLGGIDSEFKLASRAEAVEFSLELDANRALLESGRLPMGFHAMYKYDPKLWQYIFPDSPDPQDVPQVASPFAR